MTVEAQSIWANPTQIEEPLWVAQQVGEALGVDSHELLTRLESDREFVYLKRQVEPAVAEQIAALEVRGSTPIRSRLASPPGCRLPCHRVATST